MFSIPTVVLALALLLLAATPLSFLQARRGGRNRALPGWVGFWTLFAILLVCLSRAPRWVSFPLLGGLMFWALKHYFFLAPVRPQDRMAMVTGYLLIPVVLTPAYQGAFSRFVTVSVAGLLVLTAFLAVKSREPGFFDSTGRVLAGALFFLFCFAHLGVLTHEPIGRLEMFGVVTFLAEACQRMIGRPHLSGDRGLATWGVAVSAIAASAAGYVLAPLVGVAPLHGATISVGVAAATAAGALVADAVAEDLKLPAQASFLGRGAYLDRTLPILYAAPLFCYYLKWVSGAP